MLFISEKTQGISNFCAQREIKCTFIPSDASHMGGVWERTIQTAKRVLKVLLRTADCKGRELSVSDPFCQSIIFCPKIPFSKAFVKITFKSSSDFFFLENYEDRKTGSKCSFPFNNFNCRQTSHKSGTNITLHSSTVKSSKYVVNVILQAIL